MFYWNYFFGIPNQTLFSWRLRIIISPPPSPPFPHRILRHCITLYPHPCAHPASFSLSHRFRPDPPLGIFYFILFCIYVDNLLFGLPTALRFRCIKYEYAYSFVRTMYHRYNYLVANECSMTARTVDRVIRYIITTNYLVV